jgi:signal transduction histidine kinase
MGRRHDRKTAEAYREKRRELRRDIDELKQQYHEKLYAEAHLDGSHPRRQRYRYYHRHIHYGRPIAMLLMLAFWLALFFFGGFSLWFRVFIGALAILSTISGIMEILFLFRMDQRILVPLDSLEDAAREIAKGNYAVEIKGPYHPETENLVRTFNAMAKSLREAEATKRAYEENRKELVANISHDLKTPITSIIGYLAAIEDIGPTSPEKISRYLSVIQSNAAYTNRLIDDLFLFSRLDINRVELAAENVDVGKFLGDLMEEFSIDLSESGAVFSYDDGFRDLAPEANRRTEIDPKLFCRIVRNLIDNARKYGPKSGLHVEVASGLARNAFFVEIADNGPGIPEDDMPRLFERFFRVDAERTKNAASTGLGLAIARELTELHGGKITAQNRASGGLVFRIEIPFASPGAKEP